MPTFVRIIDHYDQVMNKISSTAQEYTAYDPFFEDTKPLVPTRTARVQGWRPPTPYTRRITISSQAWVGKAIHRQKNADGSTTVITWPTHADVNNGNYTPTWGYGASGAPVINWSGMSARAEIECKIKLKQQNVQYCTALAESGKSVEAITTLLSQLFGAYKSLRNGDIRGALAHLGLLSKKLNRGTTLGKASGDVAAGVSGPLANRWLELQYGWLPILQDLKGLLDDMQRSFTDRGYHISAKRVVKQNLSLEWFTTHTNKLDAAFKQSGEAGVKVRLDYDLRSDALSHAATVGLTNPAEVAWELVPFSFLFDWIVPLGDWLSSLDADFGLLWKGGSKTQFLHQKIVGECIYSGPTSFAGGTWEKADFKRSYQLDSTTRTIYTSTPNPIPYLKSPVSTLHAMNALALGRALLSGSKIPSYVRN